MGWRVAQLKDVMRGWAGEVSGEILVREGGRAVLLGKRMGEMNGLWFLVRAGEGGRREDIRIIELSHLGEAVYHLVGPWPGEIRRIIVWSGIDVCGGVLYDEIAICLFYHEPKFNQIPHLSTQNIPLESNLYQK